MKHIARKFASPFKRPQQDESTHSTPPTRGKRVRGGASRRKDADDLQSRRAEHQRPESARVKPAAASFNNLSYGVVTNRLGVALKALVCDKSAHYLVRPELEAIAGTLKQVVELHERVYPHAPSRPQNEQIARLFKENLREALRGDRVSADQLRKMQGALGDLVDASPPDEADPHALLTVFKEAVDKAVLLRGGPSAANTPAPEDGASVQTPRTEDSARLASPRQRTSRDHDDSLDGSSESDAGDSHVGASDGPPSLQENESSDFEASDSQAADVQRNWKSTLWAVNGASDMGAKLGRLLDAVEVAVRATGSSKGLAEHLEALNQAVETFCAEGLSKAKVASLVDAEKKLVQLSQTYPNDVRIRKLRIEVLAQLVNRAMALMQKKHGFELHELNESNVLKLKKATLVKLSTRAAELLKLAQGFNRTEGGEGLKEFTASLRRVEQQAKAGLDLLQKSKATAKTLKPRTQEDDVAALKQAEQALKNAIGMVDLQEFEHLGDTLQSVSTLLTSVVTNHPDASRKTTDKEHARQQLSRNLCAALLRNVMPSLTESELFAAWKFPMREKEERVTELLIEQIQFSAMVEVLRRATDKHDSLRDSRAWTLKQVDLLHKLTGELIKQSSTHPTANGVVVGTDLTSARLRAQALALRLRVENSGPYQKRSREVQTAMSLVEKTNVGAIATMKTYEFKALSDAVILLQSRRTPALNLEAIAPVVDGRMRLEALLQAADQTALLNEKLQPWLDCAEHLATFEELYGTGILQRDSLIDSIAPHVEALSAQYPHRAPVMRLIAMVKYRELSRAVEHLGVRFGSPLVRLKEEAQSLSRSQLGAVEKLCSRFLQWGSDHLKAHGDQDARVVQVQAIEKEARSEMDSRQLLARRLLVGKAAPSRIDGN